MKYKPVLILIPLLLAAGIGIGAWFWWQGHPPAETADRLTLYGNVKIREAQLAFNAAEHVTEVLVQEGRPRVVFCVASLAVGQPTGETKGFLQQIEREFDV